MEERNEIPFPQANDFNKIIQIIEIDNEELLKDNNYLEKYLNLGTGRQISYYLSACEFLGLVSKRNFTKKALELRELSRDTRILRLSQLIVSAPVFGEVFFSRYYYNDKLDSEQIAQLIGIIYGIDNVEVCKRRASTVIKWIDWIEQNKKEYL